MMSSEDWAKAPVMREVKIDSIAIIHKFGNKYNGFLECSKFGKKLSLFVDVTYDGKIVRWEVKETAGWETLQNEFIVEEVKSLLLEKLAKAPETRDTKIDSLAIIHNSEDKYTGILEVSESGEKEYLLVDVIFDGENVSWELKGKVVELETLEELYETYYKWLAEEVKKSILKTWAKDPQDSNLKIYSLTLEHESGNKYSGILKVLKSGKMLSLFVDVTYDGKNLMWKIRNRKVR